MRDRAGGADRTEGRPRGSLRDRVRSLGDARWPRVLSVALAVAVPVTLLAGLLSVGRTDTFLAGDLAALWLSIVATIVLGAGIDERLSWTSRTFARWLSLVGISYVLASLAVVLAALV